MKRSLTCTAALVAMLTGGAILAAAQDSNPTPPVTTTVTNLNGTIAQLNYDPNGNVSGFLVGTTILLNFPENICGGVGTLGAVGNSITYSGHAVTTTAGFESVNVTSFTNNTSKATFTQTTAAPTAFGPTSGTVKQLNYDGDGSIDGFLFTAAGVTRFASTGDRASDTLKPLLTVGATVSVTGTTSVALSACTATSTLAAIDVSSLTIGSQTIVIAGGGQGPGGIHPPGGPGGGRH
jgi:hypothetical protein